MISTETDIGGCPVMQECNSGDRYLLPCHISYEPKLHHANRAADTYPPDWIRNENNENSFATCRQEAERQQKRKHQAQGQGHGMARECSTSA